MYPVICQIGPFTVFSYGLMLAIAFIVASVLAGARAKNEGINPDIIFNLSFFIFICGIIGARLFYVFENFSYYFKHIPEIIKLQQGGLSWFGGFFAACICGFIYIKSKKLSFLKMLDLLAPFLALAQSLGRIGCLLNGCCFGKVSSFGLYFEAHDAVLIPTQLYSSIFLLALFYFLRLAQDRPHKEGKVFFLYLLIYSLGRFFIEFLRADNAVLLGGLTLFQLISIALFIFSAFVLLRISKTR